MKQKLLFLIVMLAFLLPARLSAYDFEAGGIYYDLSWNDESQSYDAAYVTSGYSYSGDIVIPAEVEYEGHTYPVTSIGDNAFNGSSITSVKIPNTVTSIGVGAFIYSSISSVEIPNSVTSIRTNAFAACRNLKFVEIPESVTLIERDAFNETPLILFIIRSTIVTFESHVFGQSPKCVFAPEGLDCSALDFSVRKYDPETTIFNMDDGIVISNDGKILYGILMEDCTSFDIPEGITTIGDYAFYGCSGITSMEIPNSVTSIGDYAFSGCSGITSLDIPNSVTSIGDYAFYGCSGITSLDIPNSVTSIGNHVFDRCNGITSLEIPNSVTSIGDCAFWWCSGLTSLNIPNSVTSIGESAFAECSGLISVVIPSSVTSIGDHAFWSCHNLQIFIINAVDVTFGSDIFGGYGPSSMKVFASKELDSSSIGWPIRSITPGTILTLMDDGTIMSDDGKILYYVPAEDCMTYAIPEGVTTIGDYVFDGCNGITSLEIPNSVTSIGDYAFSGCSGITFLEIPNSVISIGDHAFSGCSGITSLEIPNSVTSIGDYAFFRCGGLTSVVIGNSVTSIGDYAFQGCSGITSLEIPNSVTSIGDRAFECCDGLTSLTFNAENCITNGSFDSSIFPSSLQTLVFGNAVKHIPAFAFRGCSAITSLEIPNSVTSIGDYAFSSCESLVSVNLPNSLTSLGNYAFAHCRSLTSIVIPASVTSIGSSSFYWCDNLKKSAYPKTLELPIHDGLVIAYDPEGAIIEDGWVWGPEKNEIRFAPYDLEGEYIIPENVTSIGNLAFSGCIGITSLEIPNSVTSIGDRAFEGCDGLTSLTFNVENCITDGSFDSPIFPSSLQTLVFGNAVKHIPAYAFKGCIGITSLEIPNSVISIGEQAFRECSGITSLDLPESLNSIGDGAFIGCSGILSPTLVIPNSVTYIGTEAFNGFGDLKYVIIYSSDVTFGSNIFGYSWGMDLKVFAPDVLDCSALGYSVRTLKPGITLSIMEDGTVFADNGKTLYYVPGQDETSYAIPEGVTKIHTQAFVDTNFSTLIIPSSIEEIEPDAFLNKKFEKIEFTDWSKWYPYVKLGNLYSNPYWNSTPYVGGDKMVYPELPEGITEIPDYINYGLQFRNEIELPRSIKRIGAYAFYNNKELYSVILPRNLEEIGESAFEGCELLENPSFPTGLKKIENGAYKNCTQITEIELPEGLSMLGDSDSESVKGVFEGCSALERAVVVTDIDYIADNLFKDCGKLDKLYLPLELKTIGNSAFESCGTLDEITFPATLEYIGENAFRSGSISKLVIPDAVKHIGSSAFANQNISSLSIGKGIEVIPDGAFSNNPLKVVNFSEGLKEIGSYAFSSYSANIGSVVLPSTVLNIADHAFDWVSIGNLVIPDEVETLGPGSCGSPSVLTLGSYIKILDANAFSFDKLYTMRLKAHMPPTLSDAFPLTEEINDQLTLIVNKGRHDTYNTNARWKQIDRILEEGESEVVIYLDGTYSMAEEIRMQSGYMPAAVTKMKVVGPLTDHDLNIMRENMIALTSLDMSEVTNVTSLPDNQFDNSLITDIVLPENLETIGDRAFNNCRLLDMTELPASVKRIGSYAFSGCPKVNLNNLPESLEHIGYQAFSNSGMREVVASPMLSVIESDAFCNCTLLERADLSMAAINSISDNVFSGCKELDEVILPKSVRSIGNSAFSNTALRNIDFASEVETIGGGAFSSNRRLVSATLPESLTQVGSNLFSDCPRLISVSMPMTTTNVGRNILGGDRKLANISCSAIEAPNAETGAFDGLRYRYVTLAIPTLSFRKYLNSTQWGKFECIKNTIKVNIDRGVKVTNADEGEYQDMLKEDELEADQEAAAQQNGGMTPARAMRRAAARANTPQNFAALFDGAQLASTDGSANRIFITTDPDVNVISILFNDEEMIDSFDGQSILLPEGKFGTLEIRTDAPEPIKGDSNGNGELNIADAVNTANYAVGNEVANFVFETADVNDDGDITLSDASGTITLLLSQTVEASAAMKAPAAIVGHEDGRDALVMDGFDAVASQLNVRLDSRRDYVALQADIVLPEDCGIANVTAGPRATGHSLMMRQVGENIYRVVLFDLGNRSFNTGNEALFTLHLTSDSENTEDIVLNNIVAADKAGNEYRLKSTTEIGFSSVEAVDMVETSVTVTDGKIAVTGEAGAVVTVYSIAGNVVDRFMTDGATRYCDVEPGIYIVSIGNKSVKVVVK